MSLLKSQLAPVLGLTAVFPGGRDQLDAVVALQSPVQNYKAIVAEGPLEMSRSFLPVAFQYSQKSGRILPSCKRSLDLVLNMEVKCYLRLLVKKMSC
jgi:hypothetical protein